MYPPGKGVADFEGTSDITVKYKKIVQIKLKRMPVFCSALLKTLADRTQYARELLIVTTIENAAVWVSCTFVHQIKISSTAGG